MQNTIEQIVEEAGNFSMRRLADAVWPLIENQPAITAVTEQLKASLRIPLHSGHLFRNKSATHSA